MTKKKICVELCECFALCIFYHSHFISPKLPLPLYRQPCTKESMIMAIREQRKPQNKKYFQEEQSNKKISATKTVKDCDVKREQKSNLNAAQVVKITNQKIDNTIDTVCHRYH